MGPHAGRKVFTLQTLPNCNEPFVDQTDTEDKANQLYNLDTELFSCLEQYLPAGQCKSPWQKKFKSMFKTP